MDINPLFGPSKESIALETVPEMFNMAHGIVDKLFQTKCGTLQDSDILMIGKDIQR